jgi:hypothetical protein
MVAGIAAWSSYSHMVHVALRFGERPEVAWLLPFSVDGMLVVASVAMVDDKRSGRRVRPMARIAFAAGVARSRRTSPPPSRPGAPGSWPPGPPWLLLVVLVVEMLSPHVARVRCSPASHSLLSRVERRRWPCQMSGGPGTAGQPTRWLAVLVGG